MSEELGNEDKIQPVTIIVGAQGRSWEIPDKYTEDICSACTAQLLSTFFGIKVEGFLVEVPIMPIHAA
jgi:hypothetical protein